MDSSASGGTGIGRGRDPGTCADGSAELGGGGKIGYRGGGMTGCGSAPTAHSGPWATACCGVGAGDSGDSAGGWDGGAVGRGGGRPLRLRGTGATAPGLKKIWDRRLNKPPVGGSGGIQAPSCGGGTGRGPVASDSSGDGGAGRGPRGSDDSTGGGAGRGGSLVTAAEVLGVDCSPTSRLWHNDRAHGRRSRSPLLDSRLEPAPLRRRLTW